MNTMHDAVTTVLAQHRGTLRIRITKPGSQQRYECSCGDNGPWHFPNVRPSTGYGSDAGGRPTDELERHIADHIVSAVRARWAEVHNNTVDVEDGQQWWRVVETDSEGPTGVAPSCAQQTVPGSLHDTGEAPMYDERGVYDCCPWPHIETNGTSDAIELVELLNSRNVRLCT